MRITSIVILIIIGLNAIAAGYAFVTDATGGSIGITTGYLHSSSPFKDFMVPKFNYCSMGNTSKT